MAERKAKSQIVKFDSQPLKVKNRPDFLAWMGLQHTIGKLSMKATTFLHTSFKSKVCTQSYAPPKLRESQLWEFWDSHLGVPRQNNIWVLVPWPGIKYTIRGKVVASPKSEPWWILWVCVCPWLVLTPKTFKLRTNKLVIWFVQVHVSSWCLSFFLVPILELQHALLPPECYEGVCPNSLLFRRFTSNSHSSLSRSLGVRHM
jgi:hypothetical protein